MAAYAALVSLMQIIDDIEKHPSPPICMDKKQVESLTQIGTFLQEFLESYSFPVADDGDNAADPLEMRIIEAAYAAEDIIESNIVNVIKLSRSTTIHDQGTTSVSNEETTSNSGEEVNCREEVSCISLYEDLHQVIEEMHLIKKVAMKIGAGKMVSAPSLTSLRSSSSSSAGQSNSSSMMVCSDDVLLWVMEKLVGGPSSRQVLPIVGMGGIGKTTLAKTVYSKQLIKEHFDVCAWATISQQYTIREILCELLYQKKEESERCEQELGSELYQYLFGRRFLIVMDDMWSIDAWDEIQHFFPNNDNGSRILVTTRLSHLSSQLNNNYSLQMMFLDEFHSWDLFCKTVFGEESCPLELVEIGKEIVKNCRGLPLSIVVVGGLLKKTEHTQVRWESIRNNLTAIVNSENDRHCLRLLLLSYNQLPIYLKPCFLYMGVFKEDSIIHVSRVIGLWISEGLIKPMHGRSLKTVAKGFLKDLSDRNLIVIGRYERNGKWCAIHDLLRDLCLRESRRYGFYDVMGLGEGSPQGISSQRRVVILGSNAWQSMSRNTRSVILEQGEVPSCPNHGLLRTLDTHDIHSNPRCVGAFEFQCVNLRHLTLSLGSTSSFPSSINLIWNLHTLIVEWWDGCNASVGIWTMPQVRDIEIYGGFWCFPDPPSNGRDDAIVLKNLEVLFGLRNFKFDEEVVKRIPNVKKLYVEYCGDEDDYYFNNIKRLCKLETLLISYKLASLHKLTFPQTLKSLILETKSEFEWEEVLEKIGELPLLKKLTLWDGCFGRGKWEIGEDHFPSLKYLELARCHGLRQWTAKDSSIFPCLEQLYLEEMKELEEIPSEIGNVPTLWKIWLSGCSKSSVMSVKSIVEEQVELQGEPLPFSVEILGMDCDSPAEFEVSDVI